MECRTLEAAGPPQILKRENAPPAIQGYAAIHYDGTPETEFELWPGALERILPGTFERAARDDDVRALFNHEPGAILGRTRAGTLRLSVDSRGLRYEIRPPDTQLSRDLLQWLERGEVTGSSFSFQVLEAAWREETREGKTVDVREIRDVKLFDVGPVTFPAYEATTAGIRDLQGAREELELVRNAREREEARGRRRRRARARARLLDLDAPPRPYVF